MIQDKEILKGNIQRWRKWRYDKEKENDDGKQSESIKETERD
jgi:hypothetical protein